MSVNFTDDFNRANENLEDSPNWTRVGGSAGGMVVDTNTARGNSGTNSAYQDPDSGIVDGYAQCVRSEASLADSGFPCCIRVTDDNNYIGLRNTGSVLELYKRDTSFTLLDSYSYTHVAGDVWRLEDVGGVITGYINDVARVTSSDTFNNTETRKGVVNRKVDAVGWLDDWESGTFGASIATVPSTVARGEADLEITGTGFGATQGSGSVTLGGETCTITAWSDTSITVTIPTTINLLYAAATHTFTVTADDTSSDTSAAVPFTPASGRSYITLSSPVYSSNEYILFGYTGTPAPVTGDQLEYNTVTTPTPIANTPELDSEWVLASMPTANQTSTCQIIRAATSVRSSDWVITWVVSPVKFISGAVTSLISSLIGGLIK